MAEIKLRGLVLREVEFGDYDRYLTLLTADGRRLEVLCKGVRRMKRQNAAARQLCWSEFILLERDGKYKLREAYLLHSFFPLAENIESFALACYLCELASAFTDYDIDHPDICLVLLHALYNIERGKRKPELIKSAFEWRVMVEAGYSPDFSVCGVCGERITRYPICFSVPAGQAAHIKCAERVGGWVRLWEATSRAIEHIRLAEPKRVFAFELTGPACVQFCGITEQFVLYHLERGFDSLDFYHSLTSLEKPNKRDLPP